MTQTFLPAPNPDATFSAYGFRVYMLAEEATGSWGSSELQDYLSLTGLYSSSFGSRVLATISTAELQRHLNSLSKKHCYGKVLASLVFIQAIFLFALAESIIQKSPAIRLVIPTSVLQMAQLETLLFGRDLTLLRVLTRCGLRPGEVFGLQVGDLRQDMTLRICRSISRDHVSPMIRIASAKVPLPKALDKELRALIQTLDDQSPEAWLFPSTVKFDSVSKPLRAEIWLRSVLMPAAKSLEFAVTFESLRRGRMSEVHDHGLSFGAPQGVMRHSKVNSAACTNVDLVTERLRTGAEIIDELIRFAAEELPASASCNIRKSGPAHADFGLQLSPGEQTL